MIASEAAGARWALSQFTWLLSARCAGDRVLHAIRLWIARFYAHTEQLSELRIARNTRSVT